MNNKIADRWNTLQAAWREADRAQSSFYSELSIKYGSGSEHWASKTELKKDAQLRARRDRVSEKMYAHLAAHSPRNWESGVPAHWVCRELSAADAFRPKNEPLSVTPPRGYGSDRDFI
jgi:hypothetical protein